MTSSPANGEAASGPNAAAASKQAASSAVRMGQRGERERKREEGIERDREKK